MTQAQNESRHVVANRRMSNAYDDCELEAVANGGGEQTLPNSGGVTYFRRNRLTVKGDMEDLEVLAEVSRLCENHGLKVDRHNGQTIAGKQYAVLRVDWEEVDSNTAWNHEDHKL